MSNDQIKSKIVANISRRIKISVSLIVGEAGILLFIGSISPTQARAMTDIFVNLEAKDCSWKNKNSPIKPNIHRGTKTLSREIKGYRKTPTLK